jgi:hypothetical protein
MAYWLIFMPIYAHSKTPRLPKDIVRMRNATKAGFYFVAEFKKW